MSLTRKKEAELPNPFRKLTVKCQQEIRKGLFIMATTCTAELIFGMADQNSSGIQFNYRLMVYEGFKAMLVFERKPSMLDRGELIDRWLCHTEHFVEDAMVMIASYGSGNRDILDIIARIKEEQGEQKLLNLYEVDKEIMDKMYVLAKRTFKLKVNRTCNSISARRDKIVACIFKSSSLWNQAEKFLDYDIDLEVCKTIFKSEYSAWNDTINRWGELR